ncbi:UNKNOWN [Stylonychia lemnae]|uniref:Uncharacterized protein n=1 Tax=Stylonychia lemnae TaxID=5949 RepID=A0A078B063_STYLE|nr:UNKNOWN [Stylonychia lemnae]|eukprot:CDW86458.1 UNKNOWN [Stylonychia lemnae]
MSIRQYNTLANTQLNQQINSPSKVKSSVNFQLRDNSRGSRLDIIQQSNVLGDEMDTLGEMINKRKVLLKPQKQNPAITLTNPSPNNDLNFTTKHDSVIGMSFNPSFEKSPLQTQIQSKTILPSLDQAANSNIQQNNVEELHMNLNFNQNEQKHNESYKQRRVKVKNLKIPRINEYQRRKQE